MTLPESLEALEKRAEFARITAQPSIAVETAVVIALARVAKAAGPLLDNYLDVTGRSNAPSWDPYDAEVALRDLAAALGSET